MNRSKLIALSLSAAMLLFTLTACGGGGTESQAPTESKAADPAQSAAAGAPEDKPVKLRMASVVANSELEARNTGMAAGLMTWIDTVQAESGGSITVDLFPDSQLASGTDAIVNGIQPGAFEVAHFTTGNWSEYSNAFAELNVPFLYDSYEAAGNGIHGDIGGLIRDDQTPLEEGAFGSPFPGLDWSGLITSTFGGRPYPGVGTGTSNHTGLDIAQIGRAHV